MATRAEPTSTSVSELFRRFACKSAEALGSSWAFVLALLVIVVWAATGPIFGFSDTWQLIINTGTTIVTFLMVFLIQNAQNRDARAFHLKLDELIHAIKAARNELIDVEDLSDDELTKLQREFERLRQSARTEKSEEAAAEAEAVVEVAKEQKTRPRNGRRTRARA